MKQSLYFVSTLLLLLLTTRSFAQDIVTIEIKVDDDPVESAYFFINGKLRAASDSSGAVRIPYPELKTGDTLSAKYVGSTFESFIFNGEEHCSIQLTSTEIMPVTITPSDKNLKLRKVIRGIQQLNWYEELTGQLSMRYRYGEEKYSYDGRMKYVYIPDENNHEDLSLDIFETEEDPNARNLELLKSKYFPAIFYYASIVVHFPASSTFNKGIKIIACGQSDSMNVYDIARQYPGGQPYLLRVFVDPATRIARQAYVCLPFEHYLMEIEASYETNPGRWRIYPSYVKGTYKDMNTGKVYYTCELKDTQWSAKNIKKHQKYREKLLNNKAE